MLIFEPERHRVAAPKMSAAFFIYITLRLGLLQLPFQPGILRRQVGRGRALRLRIGVPRRARPRLAELPYPAAQLRLVDAEFRCDIHDRQPARLDALRSLPLELIRKIPALLLLHRTLLPLARKPIMGVHQSGAGSPPYRRRPEWVEDRY